MCKHKSGGMSRRPSSGGGAADGGEGASNHNAVSPPVAVDSPAPGGLTRMSDSDVAKTEGSLRGAATPNNNNNLIPSAHHREEEGPLSTAARNDDLSSSDPNDSDEDHTSSSENSPMLAGGAWGTLHSSSRQQPPPPPRLFSSQKACDIPPVCIKDGSATGRLLDFGYPCGHYVCSGTRAKPGFAVQSSLMSQFQQSNERTRRQGACSVYLDNDLEPTIEATPSTELHPNRTNSFDKWAFPNSGNNLDCASSSSIPTQKTISYPILTVSDSLVQTSSNSDFRPRVNTDIPKMHYLNGAHNIAHGEPSSYLAAAGPSYRAQGPSIKSASIEGSGEKTAPTLEGDDDDFRGRSFSLTPTINFAIFESDSSSESDVPAEEPTVPTVAAAVVNSLPGKDYEESKYHPMASVKNIPTPANFPISYSAAQLSLASSYGDSGGPICKICHMVAKEGDPLISPCRCSGTMQYIHINCLMKWLEISSKKTRKPLACELCQYQYHWHKKFKVRHWQFPHCSRKDKILHLLFFFSVLVMVACATVTILCFKQDKGTRLDPDRNELSRSEIVTLACGVLFFLAFFVAMYVEVKARNTIYRLALKFFSLNQQWYIDEYAKKEQGPVDV